jgi:uncharacterized protein (DUF1330 family)
VLTNHFAKLRAASIKKTDAAGGINRSVHRGLCYIYAGAHGRKSMKTKLKVTLALLAGAAMGVAGAEVIHAQQVKVPKGYVIAEVKVKDMATFQKYIAAVPATLAPYNGQFLVRPGKLEALEGDAPERFTVIGFDSFEKAKAWEDSPAYGAIKGIRQNSTTSRIFIVEGVPAP